MKNSTLIVIPAHNEAETIGCVIDAVRARYDIDIVVIDDGSDDATAAIARQHGAHVESQPRGGYGAATLHGFSYACQQGYEAIATIDGDGQHDTSELGRFFELAREWDVVSGTRYHPQSPVIGCAPPERVRLNREMTEAVRCVTGYDITDAFCGMKAYRCDALRKLRLTETGYAFPMQFWVQAARAGLTVIEVPVKRIYLSSTRSFGSGLDDFERRRDYYRRALRAELQQWPERAQRCPDTLASGTA